MKILLTNDDGILSEGIRLLAIELQKFHDVYIVAPDGERSATSHSITLTRALDLKKVKLEGVENTCYSVSGTPADCVRVGLEMLYDDIDVVFSGINRGYNAGADVIYSGTVGACAEANVYNKPGVAVSTEFIDGSSNFEVAAKIAPRVFEKFKDIIMDDIMVVNINVPKLEEHELKGSRICPLGGIVQDIFEKEELGNGEYKIHLLGRKPRKKESGTDRHLLDEGYVTITPIKYGFGDESLLEEFR